MVELSDTIDALENQQNTATTAISLATLTNNDIEESPLKRFRTTTDADSCSIEGRIESILSCCVCLDLSTSPIFQCTNGHLMCAFCFHYLLADYNLKEQEPVCPNCRCNISNIDCTRNLAVEKMILEFSVPCKYCSHTYPRREIESHESTMCPQRVTTCEYSLLGCDWTGTFQCLASHSAACEYPKKTGEQLLDAIRVQNQACKNEKKCIESVLGLITFNYINVIGIILRLTPTNEHTENRYFKASSFLALNFRWEVCVYVNDNKSHPHVSSTRWLSYKLILKSNINKPIKLQFFLTNDPRGNKPIVQIQPKIYQFEFNEDNDESEYCKIPINSYSCNRILSSSVLRARLWIVRLFDQVSSDDEL